MKKKKHSADISVSLLGESGNDAETLVKHKISPSFQKKFQRELVVTQQKIKLRQIPQNSEFGLNIPRPKKDPEECATMPQINISDFNFDSLLFGDDNSPSLSDEWQTTDLEDIDELSDFEIGSDDRRFVTKQQEFDINNLTAMKVETDQEIHLNQQDFNADELSAVDIENASALNDINYQEQPDITGEFSPFDAESTGQSSTPPLTSQDLDWFDEDMIDLEFIDVDDFD